MGGRGLSKQMKARDSRVITTQEEMSPDHATMRGESREPQVRLQPPIPSLTGATVGLGTAGPHPGEPTIRGTAHPRPSVSPKGRCTLQDPSSMWVVFQQFPPCRWELRGAGEATKLSHLVTQFLSACQKLFRPQMTGLEAA